MGRTFELPVRFALAASLVALGLMVAFSTATQAQSQIVNINAKVSGCTNSSKACDSAADHLPPGTKIQLISPVNVRLPSGTYRISNAGAAGRYNGWRINSDNWWVWNFGIAVKQSGGFGKLLYVALAKKIFTSQKAIAGSKVPIFAGPGGPNAAVPKIVKSGGPNAYVDTITLSAPTTLSFFILDYYVSDNAGGVSLRIDPVITK